MEKLHSVDDAFRQQLESVQAAHQAELHRLAKEKQKQIEQANQKVRVRCTNKRLFVVSLFIHGTYELKPSLSLPLSWVMISMCV